MPPKSARTTPDPPGLTFEERLHLLAWIDAARGSGVDAIEDLRVRPWPMPVAGNVIGIFRAGEKTAAWLLVGQNGLWALVSVAEGTVSETRPSLAEALAAMPSAPEATPRGSGAASARANRSFRP